MRRREGWSVHGEWRLLIVLACEIAVFSLLAPSFSSIANFFEIARFSVEVGLIALAMTPIIVTGGIDLSVGSTIGLSAVVFGIAAIDWHWPPAIAAGAALLVGLAAGAVNAALIAVLRLPPLIVTLGSLALFRGIAHALTEAAKSYSGFPASFLYLGQGYVGGLVPAQVPLFCLALIGYAILLHRSVIGRACYAIGLSAEGARYAGIPVDRRLWLLYSLSGAMAGIAAVVYVAHLGQARSDAATGYELNAITAVVLGGASVAGGRGTIWGTSLGLLTLSVLQNGLQLSALPSELTGVVTGGLLILTILIDRIGLGRGAWGSRNARDRITARGNLPHTLTDDEVPVRNSQVAVLCGAMLASGLIVAGTNAMLIRSLERRFMSGPAPAAAARPNSGAAAGDHKPVLAMMPKAKGDPYFVSCRIGAEEAARELGVELIWDGPTGLDAAKQNELAESWITRKVDVIAVAVENRASISTVLRKARDRGIRVLTWDADAEPDARDYFVNQATFEGIGDTLTDEAARLLGGRGEFAIITGALSAANQNAWIAAIRQRLAEKYPGLKLAVIRPSDDDRDKAFAEAQTIMRAYPSAGLILAISAPAVPGAAEAVRQAGRHDVKVIGLSLPNLNKPYVHDGWVQSVVLWNTGNLGYLTVQSAAQLMQGILTPGKTSMTAGKLGAIDVRGQEIILGPPLVMTKANIDGYDF
jgi:rhamnose transport system permease protein